MTGCIEKQAWLARVSSTSGLVVGAAWAVDGEHLVTCAHVVCDAGAAGPGGEVRVDFPTLGAGCDAVVLEEGWAPAWDEGMAGDLALLRVADAPAGLGVLPLRSLRSLDGLDFTAYGFPPGYEAGGFNLSGMLGKAVGLERVQLEVGSEVSVVPGFSGAGVWSDKLRAVVGMLTSRDRETGGRVAFAVPMRVIAAYSAIVEAALQTPLDLDRDRAAHWGPRSRGVSSDRDHAGWLFSGRERALSELVVWLAEDRPPALRVVTGTPGSGKSAVLARLVTSSDHYYRCRIPGLRPDDPTVPPEDAFDVTFHASGRTVRGFVEHVAALAEVDAEDAGTLLSGLDEQDGRLVFAVDAVDEASEPHELCWLLRDLAARRHRVLVGCRPHLAGELSDPEPICLDKPRYLNASDVETYVSMLLSWLRAAAGERNGHELAAEVAAAAKGNFLVAQLIAQAVAASGRVERPFPRNVAQAFERLLAALPNQAHDLLLPLALAFGDGLPRELWLTGAEVLRRRYQSADLDDLLKSPAASFLITHLDAPGGRRHRLFHQALTETLTRGRDLADDQKRLLATWTGALTVTADGHRCWSSAPDYLREHAAEHAALAGVLDQLVEDPGYLTAADLHRLLISVARNQSSLNGEPALLRLAAAHAQPLAPQRRGFLLALAACHLGLAALANRIASRARAPWRPAWAHSLGQPHQLLTGHPHGLNAVALGRVRGRDVVASAGLDGTVRLWDANGGEQLGLPLKGHTGSVRAVALGRFGERDVVASAGVDRTVRLWDANGGEQLGEPLAGHTGSVEAVALGRVGGRDVVASAGLDGTVRLWDANGGEQLGEPLAGHTGSVEAVALGRVGGRDVVASAGNDGTVRLWDANGGEQLGLPLAGHTGPVRAVALGRVGERDVVASAGLDGTVRLWDANGGEQLGLPLAGHTGSVRAVALGRVGGRDVVASAGNDGTVRLWDAASGQELRRLLGHTDVVNAVALGRVGEHDVVASAGNDRTVRLWDANGGEQLGLPLAGHTGSVRAVALGRVGGRDVVASAGDDRTVRLWDAASGQELRRLLGHTDVVNAVALGRVGEHDVVASAGNDGRVPLWGPVSSKLPRQLPTRHADPVRAVALGRVGEREVVASAGDDRAVRLWDAASGQELRRLLGHTDVVNAVALGRVGERDVVASAGDDRTVRLWDAASGQELRRLLGHADVVNAVALGRVGERDVVASAGDDRTVRLWDANGGEQLGEPLAGHTGSVRTVALGRFGGHVVVASAGDDGTVRLWDAHTRAGFQTLDTLAPVTALTLAPRLGVFAASGPAICSFKGTASVGA